jgi:predicted Zn-dependent protease with MMP-like domain
MNFRPWERLRARAERALSAAVADLSPEVAAEARQVPCLFLPVCEDDPELLGTYGHFTPGAVSPANGPIILYLETIADYCEDEGADFEEEVRVTFLHELGHHLGWDEGDLEERGLG